VCLGSKPLHWDSICSLLDTAFYEFYLKHLSA